MPPESREFRPLQAQEIASAFQAEAVEYFVHRQERGHPAWISRNDAGRGHFHSPVTRQRAKKVAALRKLGFPIEEKLEQEIIAGKDFVQIKTGPYDLDLVFAPDGIPNFAEARARAVTEGIFPVANLRDIIASKRASGRRKDEIELPLLESFRVEYEKLHAPALRSVAQIV